MRSKALYAFSDHAFFDDTPIRSGLDRYNPALRPAEDGKQAMCRVERLFPRALSNA